MASDFEGIFDHGMDVMNARLATAATYTVVATAVSSSVNVIFNEQVGFVDNKRRAVFTFDRDDISSPVNGDYFVLTGETDRWTIVDVRDDRAGGIEVRCDGKKERQ